MGRGFLKIQTVTESGAILVNRTAVTITDENNNTLYNVYTDENGNAPDISLEAPDIIHNEEMHKMQGPHYAKYNVLCQADGYRPVKYEGVMIFSTSTSVLTIELEPAAANSEAAQEVKRIIVSGHALDRPVEPEKPQRGQ